MSERKNSTPSRIRETGLPAAIGSGWKEICFRHRHGMYLLGLGVLFVLYVANIRNNPPGFYIDESSIALNAYTISQTGVDEFGVRWPLYFRSFGEYKNPVYIYLLAALFKLTGPSILVARLLSLTLGFSAALIMGLLALRISRSHKIAILVTLNALWMPWLFEIAHLVFEVALYPLALSLFLLAVHRAYDQRNGSMADCLWVAFTLALLTYSYTIGRLLGPLLALGLLLFFNRQRWSAIALTWVTYAMLLVPLGVFHLRNPGAFTARFNATSYLVEDRSLLGKVWIFLQHYFDFEILYKLLVQGDTNPVHHVEGMGSIFVPTVILAVAGVGGILYRYRRDPWWQFLLYGVVVCMIPASLTHHDFHTLRLIPLPVFLNLLMIPALIWLLANAKTGLRWQTCLVVLGLCTLLQATIFQWQFHHKGPGRIRPFDAEYPTVLEAALANPQRPIYLMDDFSYVHAYWYAILGGIELSAFEKNLHPPSGGLVVGMKLGQPSRVTLVERGPYIAYIAQGYDALQIDNDKQR